MLTYDCGAKKGYKEHAKIYPFVTIRLVRKKEKIGGSI